MSTSFGNRLREQRLRRHLSQEALAEALALSARSIRRWEQGQALPQASVRLQLSRFFNLPPEALFDDSEDSHVSHPPLRGIPYPRNPFFTGREELLRTLHTSLQAQQGATLPHVYALNGLGGVGKTHIALEYAYRYAQEYRAVFWIEAETPESMADSLLRMAEMLRLRERNEKELQRVLEAVQHWLTTHDQWLLICDNVEDLNLLDQVLPSIRQGAVLLTTRLQTLGVRARSIPLQPMEYEEGLRLLLRRAKVLPAEATAEQMRQLAVRLPAQYEAAQELVNGLGGLPLALDQAGAYLEETQCGLLAYVELLRTRWGPLLQQRGEAAPDHPASVSTTFTLAINAISQRHPAVRDLLKVCALLQPEAIPEALFHQGAEYLGTELAAVTRDALDWNQVVAIACSYSLLSRQPVAQTLSIHRLVQAVLVDTMTQAEQDEWTSRVVGALDAAFPALGTLYPEALPTEDYILWRKRCERLVPHVLLCFHRPCNEDSLALASLSNKTARYLLERGLYTQTEPLLQRALQIQEHILGPDHPLVGDSLNHIANLYWSQGRYTEEEPVLLRELRIREQNLDRQPVQLANTLNDLALLYWRQGHYEQTENLYLRALHILEQAQEAENLLGSDLRNHLALLYSSQGKYTEAEPLYQQALHICEHILGLDHLYNTYALNNLGQLYRIQGRYAEAEPLYQRALQTREQVLGPEHPDVATLLNNQAELAREQNRYAEAEPLYLRALLIREHALGPNHHLTAQTLNGLANLFRDQGRYAEAEPLYQRARSLQEQQLGPQHPETAQTLHDLAVLAQKQGDLHTSLSLAEQALAIRSQSLGDTHPQTASTRALLVQLQLERERVQQERH